MKSRFPKRVHVTDVARKLVCVAWIVGGIGGSMSSVAETFPSQPVKLVVPYTPGTGPDTVARLISKHLGQTFNQPVVVDNRPGASGNIGATAVARAKPDGHTLLMSASTIVTASMLSSGGVDPSAELMPISLVARSQLMLVASSKSSVLSLADLIAAAKANPGKITYSSPGVGTPHHMAMELFQRATEIKLMHIPYKGTAGALTDLMSGQVDVAFLGVSVALPALEGGRVRGLAIGSSSRDSKAPDVRTLEEAGVKGANSEMWFAFFGPKQLRAPLVTQLNAAVRSAVGNPAIRKALDTAGLEPATSSSEALSDLVQRDTARWAELIKTNRITGD